MSIRASLLARLKRLEEQRGGQAEKELKALVEKLPIQALFELSSFASSPSPRMMALLDELEPQCSTEAELVAAMLGRLAAESDRELAR